MAFSATNKLTLSSRINDPDALGPSSQVVNRIYQMNLGNGTDAGQANLQYADAMTIAGGANLDLDLTALTDAFGNTINFASVVTVALFASDDNAEAVTIGGSTADFAGVPDGSLAAGQLVLYHCSASGGIGAVTDGTADTVRLTAGASGADVEVYILGRDT